MSGTELVVIVFIALLIFGPQRIPEIARTVSKAYRELTRLRKQMDTTLDEVKRDLKLDAEFEELSTHAARGKAVTPRPPTEPRQAAQEERALFEPLPVPVEDDYLAPEPRARSAAQQSDTDPLDDYLERQE
jgi:TatA/E family protein of Tat protein translocase